MRNENIPCRCKGSESVNCFDLTLNEPFSQFPGPIDSKKRKKKNMILLINKKVETSVKILREKYSKRKRKGRNTKILSIQSDFYWKP